MQTKFGVITPELVRRAFVETGLNPTPHLYLSNTSACGLGVLCAYFSPKEYELQRYADGRYEPDTAVEVVLGITPDQQVEFSTGFAVRLAHELNVGDSDNAFELGVRCRDAVRDLEKPSDD